MRRGMSVLLVVAAACSSGDGGPGGGSGGGIVRHTTVAGAQDTVHLNASVAVVVDNSTGVSPIDLDLSTPPDTGTLTGSAVLGSAMLRVGGLAEGRHAANVRQGSGGPVLTALFTAAHQLAGDIRSFLVQSTDPEAPTPFWTIATGTDVIDPATGQVRTVEAMSLQPRGGGSADYLVKLADLSQPCTPPRLTDLEPGHSGDGRIPLILIHGWNFDMKDCSDYGTMDADANHSPFEAILVSLDANVGGSSVPLHQRYHPYVFHYPTYQSVINASAALRSAIATLPGGPPVIVAHSMGGLVARAMFGLSGAPEVRGLVTIGTPHAGAPMASMLGPNPTVGLLSRISYAAQCGLSGELVVALGSIPLIFAPTAGLGDLAPDSPLIQSLATNRPSGDRVYSIGGKLGLLGDNNSDPKKLIALDGTNCLSRLIDGGEGTDGVVPPSSALPAWTAGQWLISSVDHLQLPQSPSVVALVDTALSRWSNCGSPPAITTTNAFPVSGSVGREPDGTVDVTINGIVINGAVQTNLPASDFTIVENGCTIPRGDVVVSNGEGHVGVDLVFVQDLSGSMDNVIAGVRNSVNSFASGLTAQGFDIRFGSVGYSGFVSHIPSSPAGSFDEYLGPVQDFTTAAAFQQHVASQWSSGGGNDDPENGLEAIEYAMNHLSWRTGAVRVLVDITNSSHHTAADSCDGDGPCTDETLASITRLLSGQAVLHAVAPEDFGSRTIDGGLDPWLIATATGGKDLVLGNGIFDLNAIGLSSAIAATTRLTFRSASANRAPDNLRVLVTINGQTSELAPGLVTYLIVPPSLRHRAQ
ncbi:MAG TPA: alpha/beta fold hydrolase [Gemmatimonadales bacterium]